MKIHNDTDHAAALAELDRIWKTNPTREAELVAAIEAYEDIHYPIPEPTEEEMRQFWEGQGCADHSTGASKKVDDK